MTSGPMECGGKRRATPLSFWRVGQRERKRRRRYAMPAHSIYSQDKHATGGFCKLPCFLFSFETALSPVINGREASITVQTPADHLLVSVGNSSHLHPTHRHLHNMVFYRRAEKINRGAVNRGRGRP